MFNSKTIILPSTPAAGKLRKGWLVSVLLLTFCCAEAATLSLSHKPGKPAVLGAATGDQLPLKSPTFTLQLFPKYFKAVICTPVSPGEKLNCIGKKHDEERMFLGDVAEFFIAPDPRRPVYYQIAANPAGLVYTARKRDISWNPRIKTNIIRKKDRWTAEFTIPYSAVNTSAPDSKTVWRVNFAAKAGTAGGKKSCSWSGAGDFHKISDFGTVRFDNKPLPKLLSWDMQNDILSAVMTIPAQYAENEIYCAVNGTKYPAKIKGDQYRWRIPYTTPYSFPKQFYFAEIIIRSKQGKILFSRRTKVESEVLKRFDINSFYYTNTMKELTYTQNFAPTARLTLKNANNQTIARCSAKSSGKISLAGLKPGRYVLELTAGRQRTSRVFLIVPPGFTAPGIPSDARFEVKNGLFYLDKRPVFLVGGSSTPKKHLQFQQAFNMNTGNLGVIQNAVDFSGLGHARFLRKPFSCCYLVKNADQIIQKKMQAPVSGSRRVHRLAYEAQIQLCNGSIKAPARMDTPRYYADLYKKLKTQYPEKYFSIHIDKADRLKDFVNSCDIFEFAAWSSSYAANMMPFLVRDMKNLRAETGKRPLIFWLGGSIPNPESRMAEELRAAVYCAIINNMNGVIFHLGHGGLPAQRSRLWSLISGINAEIQPFYSEFAAGKEVRDFVKEVKGNFLYSVRQCGQNICLIAVNLNPADQMLEMKTAAGKFKFLLTPFEPLYIRLKKH